MPEPEVDRSCPGHDVRAVFATAFVTGGGPPARLGRYRSDAVPEAGSGFLAAEDRTWHVRSATARRVALLGLLALLAGCSPPSPPARLSPPIPGDPLDLGAYVAQPCDLLPAPQLVRFFVTRTGTVSAGADGLTCSWTPSDTTALTYRASIDAGGLESVYDRKSRFPVFEPTAVHSYPAVHLEHVPGHCRVVVGVTDSTILDVVIDARDATLAAYDDPCAEAESFAGAVLGYQGHRAP